jgi:hypothetical protein
MQEGSAEPQAASDAVAFDPDEVALRALAARSADDGLSSEYARTFEAFEKLYQEEHVPMILDKLAGKTRFVATRDRSPDIAQRNPATRRGGGRPRIRVVTR